MMNSMKLTVATLLSTVLMSCGGVKAPEKVVSTLYDGMLEVSDYIEDVMAMRPSRAGWTEADRDAKLESMVQLFCLNGESYDLPDYALKRSLAPKGLSKKYSIREYEILRSAMINDTLAMIETKLGESRRKTYWIEQLLVKKIDGKWFIEHYSQYEIADNALDKRFDELTNSTN